MNSAVSRISQIVNYKNIKIGELERKIGASKGVLSRAINNNTDIQSKWISNIVENYPEISARWLLTGEGEMLIDTIPANEVRDASNPEYNRQLIQAKHASEGIPLIPINAMAGWGTGDLQVMGHECERYVVPMLKEAEFLIPVKGESMHPTYRSGDIVGCKRLLLSDVFYQPNKVYVLDTDQGAIIKRVKPLRGSKRLLIISDNNEYEPFELREDQVHSVALVVGLIRPE